MKQHGEPVVILLLLSGKSCMMEGVCPSGLIIVLLPIRSSAHKWSHYNKVSASLGQPSYWLSSGASLRDYPKV